MLYKVKYYTLAMIKKGDNDYEIGNVKQYSDTYYTDTDIKNIQEFLEISIANRKGLMKYKPVITSIELIEGHIR